MGVSELALSKGGKSQMSVAIAYILVSVVLGAMGQILLKKGMGGMGPLTLSADQLGSILWRIVTSPYVVIGLGIYVCGTLFWLMALSRVDLSYAYPFASLGYVVMLVASWQLFNENISPLRLAGTLMVCLGVFLISRS
jgi:drug/metabolite transporter (DMT)-like permease